MSRTWKWASAILVVAVGIPIVAWAPLVPYATSFSMYSASSSHPTQVVGRSTLLYSLTRLGEGPYEPLALVTQNGSSALVHFAGERIVYWEGPFPPGTAVNPSGVVGVAGVSITQEAFGLLNFSAVVSNVGAKPIANLTVIFHYPGYGTNETVGSAPRSIVPIARCASVLEPWRKCVASLSLPQSPALLTDEDYPMLVEALSVGSSSGGPAYAPAFVYAYSVQLRYPGAGLGSAWVPGFIDAVNQKRNGTALIENRTLDEFAAFRYDSLRAEFQISDYNFTADYHRYFGPSSPAVLEEILYPGGTAPSTFLTYLAKHAPGHYLGLTNPLYRYYGFFFGTGPAVEVGPGCGTQEVPGPNINITQWVILHGCSYVIADEIWFIIILGT